MGWDWDWAWPVSHGLSDRMGHSSDGDCYYRDSDPIKVYTNV